MQQLKKLRIFIICVLFFMTNAQAFSQTVVNSLVELRSAVQNSDQSIVLEPGTYNITDIQDNDDRYILVSGDNNTIDITGCTIFFPVEFNTPEAHFYFSGKGNTLLGGRIENNYNDGTTEITDFVGYNVDRSNLSNGGKPHMVIAGDDTTIIGTEIIVRGSFPYGYGSYFGINGHSSFGLEKRGGIQVNSTNTVIDGVYMQMDAYGHGIYIGPGEGAVSDNTIIRNTTMIGQVRLTNDMLAESGSDSLMERNDYKDVDGNPIPENEAESMGEDGIRAYGDAGDILVENCVVRGMRSGVRLLFAGGDTKVINTVSTDNRISNYDIYRGGSIEGSTANFTYGPALTISRFHGGQKVDLTLESSPEAVGDHDIANIERDVDVIFRRVPDSPIDTDEDRVIRVSASGVNITNNTEYTILLEEGTSGNEIISCGPVIDNGSNNVTVNDCFSGVSTCETKDAFSQIEAEDFCAQAGVEINDSHNNIESIHNDDWIQFETIDFGAGVNTLSISVATPKDSNGVIEVRQDSSFGNLLGTVAIENTGGWGDYETFSADFDNITGEQNDIYFVFTGDSGFLYNVDWIQFSNESKEPNEQSVTSVAINPKNISLNIGEVEQFNAIISPSNATNKEVKWESNNTSVATINGNGLVTAKAKGTAEISVITEDGTFTAISVVTVLEEEIAVTGIDITSNILEIIIGETEQLTAEISPVDATDKTFVWSSNNETVAEINPNGVITGLTRGNVDITVTTNEGEFLDTIRINVSEEEITATSIHIISNITELTVGDSVQLIAELSPLNATIGNTFSWETSDPTVATINSNGEITAIGQGITEVLVVADGNTITDTISIEVKEAALEYVAVESITMTTENTFLNIGETEQLYVEVYPKNATDQIMTWESENPLIAVVNPNGVVSAVGEGVTVISATTEDNNLVASSTVTVENNNLFKQLILYPNPTDSEFTIQGVINATINIYDLQGKLLIDKTILSDKEVIDLSAFSAGIYYAQIIDDSSIFIREIVKK